jgi:integrase
METQAVIHCPSCGSERFHRDGLRYLKDGSSTQRWLCRVCGIRFCEQKAKAIFRDDNSDSIESSPNSEEDTLLQTVQNEKTGNISTQPLMATSTGKILEYALWLKSNGRSEATIIGRVKLLRRLTKRGANLYDPESMKKTIAEQKWSSGQKNNAVDAYASFLKMVGGKWEAPKYKTIRQIPFIPKETEIDQLIAGCSKRMATFLQTLKETDARCGEIWQLKWTDIDFESKVVNITPEKGSNPRVIHLSNRLLEMLGNLPKNYGERVFSFPHMRVDNHAVTFQRQRKKVAFKMKNPRILRIHFHTFRYWKGTMLYHQTKSEFFVMQQLGHKSITNTLLYVQLDHALFQGEVDYIAKVAKTAKEICALMEAGFDYVTDFEGAKMFRKRKT